MVKLMIDGVAGGALKQYVERIERLEQERRTLAEEIKEIYADAKSSGFDVKIMKQLIKVRQMDKNKLDEQEELLEIYKRAIGMVHNLGD